MKIIGISDIHIRNNSREEEYRSVFATLFLMLRDIKPDRIVVAGDIFHHKSTLSPESVILAPEFFEGLSNIATVDVIAGNHDLGKNLERIDAVQALIDKNMSRWNLKHPINYYRKSGVYSIDDKHEYFFWDFRSKKHQPYKKSNKIAIGLYHGAPYTIKLDSGKEMSPDIASNIFENCDYMFCGDIHKREFWNDRRYVMIGSLVCQSFTEEYYKHGFVVLDTDKKEITEHEVPSDWGYFTLKDKHLKIVDNKTVELVVKPPFKEFVLRTRLDKEYNDDQILSIRSEVRKKLKKDVTITVYVDPKKDIQEYSVMNLSDPNVQNALIEEYCKENKIANIDEIKKINIEINRKLKSTADNLYNIRWRPLELRFKNAFAFGDVESVIDFERLPGITSVLGDNGTGKSSMFHIMLFLMFAKTPKISTQGEIINDRKDTAWMQFKLQVENDIYLITKEIIRKKKTVSASITFEKWNEKTQEFEADTASANQGKDDTKTDVKQTITNIIGNYDDVLLSSFSLQNDFDEMIKQTEGERRKYVYNFLGANIFQQLYKNSSAEQSNYDATVSLYADIDFYESISIEKSNIEIYKKEVEGYSTLKEEINNEIENIDKKINHKMKELGSLKEKSKSAEKLTEINNKISSIKATVTNTTTMQKKNKENLHSQKLKLDELKKVDVYAEMNRMNQIISSNKEEIEKLEDKQNKVESEIKLLKEKKKANEDLDKKISGINTKISNLEINISMYKRQSEILDVQSWMLEFDKCKICQLAKDAFESKNKLVVSLDLKEKSFTLKEKLESIKNTKVDDLLETTEKFISNTKKKIAKHRIESDLYSDKKDGLQKISDSIKSMEMEIEKINMNITANNEKIDIYNKELEELLEEKTELEKLDSIVKEATQKESELRDLRKDKETNKGKIKLIDEKVSEFKSSIAKAEVRIENLTKEQEEYNYALNYSLLYKTYRNIVNKDGLPFVILKKLVPTFNKKINEYLTEDVADFKLKFDIEDDNLKILTQKYGDMWRDIKSAGGREIVISSWIIRAILTEFSILPKSDMLILDEGFGAFDQKNIGNVDILFNRFREKFSQIMVISHVPIIADFCDNLLEITVDDSGFSRISNV